MENGPAIHVPNTRGIRAFPMKTRFHKHAGETYASVASHDSTSTLFPHVDARIHKQARQALCHGIDNTSKAAIPMQTLQFTSARERHISVASHTIPPCRRSNSQARAADTLSQQSQHVQTSHSHIDAPVHKRPRETHISGITHYSPM